VTPPFLPAYALGLFLLWLPTSVFFLLLHWNPRIRLLGNGTNLLSSEFLLLSGSVIPHGFEVTACSFPSSRSVGRDLYPP